MTNSIVDKPKVSDGCNDYNIASTTKKPRVVSACDYVKGNKTAKAARYKNITKELDFTESTKEAIPIDSEIPTKESSKNSSSSEEISPKDSCETKKFSATFKKKLPNLDVRGISPYGRLDEPVNRKDIIAEADEDEEYRDTNIILPEDIEAIKKIGSGTFAKVYLCKSKVTGQSYALKVIDKQKIKSSTLKKYALTERKILTSVKNNFIVSLKLSFQTKTHCYLLMDYCPGKDVSEYLDQEAAFNEEKARFYICECIAAINALHNNGVLHRDLKPNNIMLDEEGHVKLIDFNLCKTGMSTSLQRTKSFCGTFAYMPPEIMNKQSYGKSVDWYLLGVILYEMLVGVPPYFDPDPEVVERNMQEGNLTFPVKLSSE